MKGYTGNDNKGEHFWCPTLPFQVMDGSNELGFLGRKHILNYASSGGSALQHSVKTRSKKKDE
ncbi:hypothetical protein CCM_00684 [Cordyceps militaris CM01]|uniref:Uncharacterized protein n=1 Tax=Cordyceps militaris (strain CM01) TaxID=983644 RepID=G3J5G8_CORMM|nr:uncharacterized protein CCM_00684 [Cordyceps militaris CM01]EGX96029.1 hypothetical protein CCM_00684 [Cordyceps militaris CM01]